MLLTQLKGEESPANHLARLHMFSLHQMQSQHGRNDGLNGLGSGRGSVILGSRMS